MITKEEVEEALTQFYKKYGRNPKKAEYGKKGGFGLPSYTTTGRVLGHYPESSFTRDKNKDKYDESPKHCPVCGKIIVYAKRANQFCSRSCAATYNNTASNGSEEKKCCEYCHEPLKNTRSSYCSIACHAQHKFDIGLNLWLFVDSDIYFRRAKEYVIHLKGYKCACCGLSEWRDKKITLELEHIDGNHENNCITNLQLLCPNCHSQTPTYKAKNKGNGRFSRAQRYRDGKSY